MTPGRRTTGQFSEPSGSERVHLELFGGAGGTAHGVARALAPAGISVWSVDNAAERHARNPYAWFTGDWREGLDRALQTGRVVSVGAAPPCTKNSAGTRSLDRSRYDNDPDLENVREVLIDTGLPYFIENVESEVTKRKMRSPLRLCGFEFGLTAVDTDGTLLHLKRHRLFESNVLLLGNGGCPGHPRIGGPQIAGAYGGARRDKDEARLVRKGGYVPRDIEVLRQLLGGSRVDDDRRGSVPLGATCLRRARWPAARRSPGGGGMSDLTTGRLPATPTDLQQPLTVDQNERPVVNRETPRETSDAELEQPEGRRCDR